MSEIVPDNGFRIIVAFGFLVTVGGISAHAAAQDLLLSAPTDALICGEPNIRAANERGLFVWRDCPDGQLHIRATSGTQELVRCEVRVASSVDFPSPPEPFSFEGARDVVELATQQLTTFVHNVKGGGWDGFDFVAPAGGSLCLTATMLPAGAQIYIGSAKTPGGY